MEAAISTGLKHWQAMVYIILPQGLRNMIPSFVNQFVSLIKDTSLAFIVGVSELTHVGDPDQQPHHGLPHRDILLHCGRLFHHLLCLHLAVHAGWRSGCPGTRRSENCAPELLLPLLFGAAFVAGLIDAIAGGGGLITVPVLMGIGLPPQVALGTNKLQASFGSGSAMLHFVRAGTVKIAMLGRHPLDSGRGGAGCLGGPAAGRALLKQLIPWLLVAIAVYTLLSPRLGAEDTHARMTQALLPAVRTFDRFL